MKKKLNRPVPRIFSGSKPRSKPTCFFSSGCFFLAAGVLFSVGIGLDPLRFRSSFATVEFEEEIEFLELSVSVGFFINGEEKSAIGERKIEVFEKYVPKLDRVAPIKYTPHKIYTKIRHKYEENFDNFNQCSGMQHMA